MRINIFLLSFVCYFYILFYFYLQTARAFLPPRFLKMCGRRPGAAGRFRGFLRNWRLAALKPFRASACGWFGFMQFVTLNKLVKSENGSDLQFFIK
jgi:hypothetical protein